MLTLECDGGGVTTGAESEDSSRLSRPSVLRLVVDSHHPISCHGLWRRALVLASPSAASPFTQLARRGSARLQVPRPLATSRCVE